MDIISQFFPLILAAGVKPWALGVLMVILGLLGLVLLACCYDDKADDGAFPSSRDFLKWGHPGFGKWLTCYAKRGHVFLVIAGMRFDTTGTSRGVGPRWYTESRPCGGFYVRHIPGF